MTACVLESQQMAARRTLAQELEARRVVLRKEEDEYEERCRSAQDRSSQLLHEGMAPNDNPGRVRSRSRERMSLGT